MLTEFLIVVCALLILYGSYQYAVFRPAGYPPGPPRIPLFGSYLFMMMTNFKYLHKAVLQFSKWYKSDIVGFYAGPFPIVAVHNFEGVREVLNNKDFDGRGEFFFAKMRAPNFSITGIFFQEGAIWKEQRRFILRYMRDFGFGRRFEELELIIQEQMGDMLDIIRNGPRFEHEKQIVQPGGYRILLPIALNPFPLNSLFHIMFNERRPRSEQAEFITLIKMGMHFQREGDDYGKLLSIMPWIRHIFPNWSSYNILREANMHMYNFFSNFINHYIATYDESCERNFLDLYIKEMIKDESEPATESSFKYEQFVMSLIDFSFPAFTAIGTQISLLIQYFMLYPEVLLRIQKEIDEVVGTGRFPCLDDRKNLHYTEATIREGMRIETLVPSDMPHKTLVDTELLGYKIPKGTIVIPGLYAYHIDKRIWSDPENFRPDRFLDSEGKFRPSNDVSLPFGAGKRLCAGETFARNMMFVMTATLCQNFNFVLAPGDKLPDLSKNLSGVIISPPDFWIQLQDRG